MKKLTTSLLLLTLLLVACSPTATTPVVDEAPSVEAIATANSNQTETSREAVLSEIENDVTIESSPASVGMVISVGQTIKTGDDSRAKLNLTPENTIVRVAPNSSFMLSQINNENGEPKTTLELLFGKVFILLNGGSLEVQTPSGVASVRGSLLSVQYDAETNRVRASCLEGLCGLKNKAGDEIAFTQNQSVFIDEDGNLSEIEEINQDEIGEWLEFSELGEFMDELPALEDYEDINNNDEFSGNEETSDNSNQQDSDDSNSGGDD